MAGIPIISDLLGGGGSQPEAPPYLELAEKTAAADAEAARTATEVNRPTQITPVGTVTWSNPEVFDQAAFDEAQTAWDTRAEPLREDYTTFTESDPLIGDDVGGSTSFDQAGYNTALEEWNNASAPDEADFWSPGNDWTQTTTLSPEQQALLEQQQSTDLLSGQLAEQGLKNTGDMFSTPWESGLDPMSSYDDQRGKIIEQLMSRTREDVGNQRSAKEGQLVAAGIPRGSPAFDKEMMRFDRQLTDALQQSELGATDIISKMLADQNKTRNQTINESLTERQIPLNELNALRTGGQITNPSFSPFYDQQPTPGTDYLGAGMAEGSWDLAGWNADTANRNAGIGAVMDLVGSGIEKDWG